MHKPLIFPCKVDLLVGFVHPAQKLVLRKIQRNPSKKAIASRARKFKIRVRNKNGIPKVMDERLLQPETIFGGNVT